jgi:uncharacterized membrane protein
MTKTKFRLLPSILLAVLIASTDLGLSSSRLGNFLGSGEWLNQSAQAKSSGGRTSGGSFKSRSSSPSRSNSSSPTRSTPRPYNPSYSQPQRSNNNIIVIPGSQPTYRDNSNYSSSSSADDGSWIIGLVILLLVVGGFGAIGYFVWRAMSSKSATGGNDLDNETVTVSKLQVALLAEARSVQTKLNEISLQADTETPEGLYALMQESAIALLRSPENWTHVQSSSQAVQRDRAEGIFSQLSITERTKFSAETLVNVGGKSIGQQSFKADPNEDPAAYIVVTLLIGTEHDKPLFGDIKSSEALEAALQAIAGIPASHLLIFELMWSPQAEADSLTYDELLTEYSDMVQI